MDANDWCIKNEPFGVSKLISDWSFFSKGSCEHHNSVTVSKSLILMSYLPLGRGATIRQKAYCDMENPYCDTYCDTPGILLPLVQYLEGFHASWTFFVLQQQQNLGRRFGTSKMHLSPQWLGLLSILRRWFCRCCLFVYCYYHCGSL